MLKSPIKPVQKSKISLKASLVHSQLNTELKPIYTHIFTSKYLTSKCLCGCHSNRRMAVRLLPDRRCHHMPAAETPPHHHPPPPPPHQLHWVRLRMLLRSLLLYSLWSKGWTSITVAFTRLSSWGGKNKEKVIWVSGDTEGPQTERSPWLLWSLSQWLRPDLLFNLQWFLPH